MKTADRNPIIVALDGTDSAACEGIARATAGYVGTFKVGLTSFLAGGTPLVKKLTALRPVFLDLKFHDIPAQVETAVRSAADLGVVYTTVHALGGDAMMQSAVKGAEGRMAVLAVTVLTSFDDASLERLGIPGSCETEVLRLAELALESGVSGIVCSPQELSAVRRRFGSSGSGGPLVVVPGVRAAGQATHDQKRTLSAREAVLQGADDVVVGRPITRAQDPAEAARCLLEDINR